ncbi:MAG: hypothetical protein ACLFVP_03960 [Candidatus Bathyarchaeia archaeon]
MGFSSGLQLLASEESRLSTGSPELNWLLNGLQPGMFYLFYGEEGLIKPLFRHITVNALIPRGKAKAPHVVYLLMGNYRRERTQIEVEELTGLMEESGLHRMDLERIHVITASSADQQSLLAEELGSLMEKERRVSLVVARGIFRLHKEDARRRNRHVVREEVQRSIMRIRQICGAREIPIVASARPTQRGLTSPMPESSSFLRHLANIIVHLRGRKRGSYNRAILIAHPARAPSSTEYRLEVNGDLGRDTPPFRQSFQKKVDRLRREFKEALLSLERRDAFEELVEAWSSELGAMSYAESMKLQDLLLLVALVDNRRIIAELEDRQIKLGETVERILEVLEAQGK